MSVNGAKLEWAHVTSGIPQDSVLGPVFFVIFINNLPEVVDSMAEMLADDTKVFRPLRHEEDQQDLQEDIDNLATWANTFI